MKVTLLPLDERPCNTTLVKKTIELNGDIEFLMPTKEILGNKKKSANLEKVHEFLFANYDTDALIVSIDMLVYGGLLPSRIHNESIDILKERLEVLKELKLKKKDIKIYAFSCIMRTPKYNSSDEEPEYYETYGYNIFRKKYLEDKKTFELLSDKENEELKNISIPAEYENDYATRREINKEINCAVIELLNSKVIDFLIIPQDDSAPYGYTRIDQKYILSKINNFENCSVHPGADEVAMTLVSRFVNDHYKKTKIELYITSKVVNEIIPNYEDREAMKSLELHLKASNVDVCDDGDVLLVYHLPATTHMEEAFDQLTSYHCSYDQIDYDEIIRKIKQINKPFVIADCAYSNGGDIKLMVAIKNAKIDHLFRGYQGWNTNCNTLGSAICLTNFVINGDINKINKHVFTHILDAVAYQANVRMLTTNELLPSIGCNYFTLKDKQASVIEWETPIIKNVMQNYCNHSYDFKIYHPWNRMFEIGVEL